jgi:hypothetical protein
LCLVQVCTARASRLVLSRSSRCNQPVMMDIGLFAYWWTGIAGDFALLPIAKMGVDHPGKNPVNVLIHCDWLRTAARIRLLGSP